MPFTCTICEEESVRICTACNKDTCGNHLCEKCHRCSDCCDCDLRLDVHEKVESADVEITDLDMTNELADGPREPEPHPHPMPDPDPAPEPDPMPIPGFPGPEQNN